MRRLTPATIHRRYVADMMEVSVVRVLACRIFAKLVASLVNGWLFAGSAIAQELDLDFALEPVAANSGAHLKIAAALVLIGVILALARPARSAG